MALNENLQGVVNNLKTAKDNIATALTNKGQTVADNEGFGTFAGKINNLKPSSYQDVSDVTATENDVLSTVQFVKSDGELKSGAIPISDFIEPTITLHPYTEWPQGSNTTTVAEVDLSLAQNTYIKSGEYSYDLDLYTVRGKTYIPSTKQQYVSGYHAESYIAGDSNLKAENIKSGVSIFGVNGSASGAKIYTITGTNSSAVSELVIYNDVCTEIYSYMTQGAILNVQFALTPSNSSTTYSSLAVNYTPMKGFMGSTIYGSRYFYLTEYRQTASSVYFSGPTFGQILWNDAFVFQAVPRSQVGNTVTAWYNWPVGTYDLTATLIIP